MRDTTKKRVLELYDKDPYCVEDYSAREIILSSRTLIKILTFAVDNYKLDFKQMIFEISKIVTPDKFQKVLQNLFMIDTIVLISCNEIRPIDENCEIYEKRAKKYKKPTRVRRWDECLIQASSEEHTEDEDVLTAHVKINKMIPSTHLTRADIEEIKSSVLYSICNTD